VALLEIRTFPPVWARNDVLFAVMVEVAEIRSLAPELVGQSDFFETVNGVILSRQAKRRRENPRDGHGNLDHANGLAWLAGKFNIEIEPEPEARIIEQTIRRSFSLFAATRFPSRSQYRLRVVLLNDCHIEQ
jgi:hypothetical protein